MAYSTGQVSNYRRKKKKGYTDLIQGAADDNIATESIKAGNVQDLNERRRSEDLTNWNKSYAQAEERNKLATKGAKFAAGAETAKMGYGLWDKFGGGGKSGFGGGWSGAGKSLGNVLGGAGIGAGIAGMFGGDEKKGGIAGGLAGLAFDLFF